MALKTSGGLETISLVLTSEQVGRLRSIRDERKSAVNRTSVSDVAREVVEEGLRLISVVIYSDSTASERIDDDGKAA